MHVLVHVLLLCSMLCSWCKPTATWQRHCWQALASTCSVLRPVRSRRTRNKALDHSSEWRYTQAAAVPHTTHRLQSLLLLLLYDTAVVLVLVAVTEAPRRSRCSQSGAIFPLCRRVSFHIRVYAACMLMPCSYRCTFVNSRPCVAGVATFCSQSAPSTPPPHVCVPSGAVW